MKMYEVIASEFNAGKGEDEFQRTARAIIHLITATSGKKY